MVIYPLGPGPTEKRIPGNRYERERYNEVLLQCLPVYSFISDNTAVVLYILLFGSYGFICKTFYVLTFTLRNHSMARMRPE